MSRVINMANVLAGWGILFFLLCLGTLQLQAQPEVEATLEPKEILIGVPSTLTLQVKHPKDVLVYWPSIAKEIPVDTSRSVEVLETGKIDTLFSGGYVQQTMKVQVTAWDTGFYIIPSFNFSYKIGQDTTPQLVQSYPVLLQVNTVAVDTTQQFKGIKDPIEVPFSIWEYKYWIIGGGVGLLALIIVLFFLLRKKPLKVANEPAKPKLPPHVVANEKLTALDAKKLWQGGEVKTYYSELSDIMREYLEGRYRFLALEATTEEIFLSLDNTEMVPKQRDQLKEVFTLSDLAKFAKMQPLPDDHIMAMRYARQFVAQTQKTDTERPNA